jgi:phospholipase C
MNGSQTDSRFPSDLPNRPFDIARYVNLSDKHPDLTHRFFMHQMQIDGGRNDRFAQLSSAGALTMGHYDLSGTALWNYAKEFTLADNFFQAAFGGSFLNHQWLICACMPVYKDAPAELKVWKSDPVTGKPVSDPSVTEDGYAVGTIQPNYPPFDSAHPENRLPPQYQPTIGDRLSEKGISWAWYSGGWDNAVAGRKTDDNFQYHHQPFVFYANYAPDTAARAEHLKDKTKLFTDLKDGFPQVAFFKPAGSKNQHPGYSAISEADQEVKEIVEAIRSSAIWPSTAIVITYDEFGGFWDHVAPPKIDRWGPGTRIPAIIVSPFAKKGYVDHTAYNTTSILKLIETRFGLTPLTDRDAQANGLQGAFR